MRAIITRSGILTVHKGRIFLKNLLEKMFLNFKKWVKSIQTTGYNGARTVYYALHWYNSDYKYWWYNFYLFVSVGCSMEYDCMWQDQANSRNDRTSQTLPELYATKITRFVIIFKVKNLSQDLYMTRWKSKIMVKKHVNISKEVDLFEEIWI